MIRRELGVPLATTLANTQKGLTRILRDRCCIETRRGSLASQTRAMRLRAYVLASAVCLLPNLALATESDGASTVVIVFEPRARSISRRLRQEIEALGFQVMLKRESSPEASLESLALDIGAVAAIRVKPLAAGGVEMTVLDRATGKTVHRDLTRVTAADPAGEELIATRTVELFRASLIELSAAHPSRGEVPVSPPVKALVSHEQERQMRQRSGAISLAAGPALLVMPTLGPSLQFWVQASWISRAGVGLSAELFSPLSAARLSGPEGAGELRATSYRLGVLWDPNESDAQFAARLSAGWSLVSVSVRGNASTPFLGQQDDFVTSAPWLSAGGRLRISSHVALVLQVSGWLSLPRATIRFAGREVGKFAQPAAFASVGPELSWP